MHSQLAKARTVGLLRRVILLTKIIRSAGSTIRRSKCKVVVRRSVTCRLQLHSTMRDEGFDITNYGEDAQCRTKKKWIGALKIYLG